MNKQYEKPEIEVMDLAMQEVLCASNGVQTEPYQDGDFSWK